MPLRVDVPEGIQPAMQMMHHIGTSRLLAARKQMLETVYDAPEATFTAREREAMRILFALRSGCPVCAGGRLWRDKPGFSEEIEEELYQAAMAVDLDWPGFTDRERLLVEFVDLFERDADINHDEALWERLNAQLTETELGDLLNMCGIWLGTGRTLKALGVADANCVLGESVGVDYAEAMEVGATV